MLLCPGCPLSWRGHRLCEEFGMCLCSHWAPALPGDGAAGGAAAPHKALGWEEEEGLFLTLILPWNISGAEM